MGDIAFYILMLTGMLGYLALIGRVLRRRRGGKILYQPAVVAKAKPTSGPGR